MTAPEIKSLRERLGLTQKAMAERIGVSRETYSRWEMPKPYGRKPTKGTMTLLQMMADKLRDCPQQERSLQEQVKTALGHLEAAAKCLKPAADNSAVYH